MTVAEARAALIQVFNDSAVMEGNEKAFILALRAYEDAVVPWDTIDDLLRARIGDVHR